MCVGLLLSCVSTEGRICPRRGERISYKLCLLCSIQHIVGGGQWSRAWDMVAVKSRKRDKPAYCTQCTWKCTTHNPHRRHNTKKALCFPSRMSSFSILFLMLDLIESPHCPPLLGTCLCCFRSCSDQVQSDTSRTCELHITLTQLGCKN